MYSELHPWKYLLNYVPRLHAKILFSTLAGLDWIHNNNN